VVAVPQLSDERHAALLDASAELRDRGREHRERAEHRHGDNEDRADGEGREHDRAGQEHAGHGDHHGEAGDEHGPARRGRGELQRGLLGASCVLLLHLSSQVEHRVVDAHGEADQQDHRVDRPVHVQQVADQRRQSERRHHRGQPEQQRDAGGHEGTEREHEDHDRHRKRGHLGPLEIAGEAVVDRLVDAGVAELANQQTGVRTLHRRGRGERGSDAVGGGVGIAGDLEGHQGGAAVT
jgi:hypothetical protein